MIRKSLPRMINHRFYIQWSITADDMYSLWKSPKCLSTLLLQLIFHTIFAALMTNLRKWWLRNNFRLCRFNFVLCKRPKKIHVSLKRCKNLCLKFGLRYLHTSVWYRRIRVVTLLPKVRVSCPQSDGCHQAPRQPLCHKKRNFSTIQRKNISEQTFSTTKAVKKHFA